MEACWSRAAQERRSRDEPATSAYAEARSVVEGEIASRGAAYHRLESVDGEEGQEDEYWPWQVSGDDYGEMWQ